VLRASRMPAVIGAGPIGPAETGPSHLCE
jgi:hypothetical protein